MLLNPPAKNELETSPRLGTIVSMAETFLKGTKMARDTICRVCHERPASLRCKHCGKPVCDECSFKGKDGVFCSRKCASDYSEYQDSEKPAPVKRRGSLLRKIIILALILAAILFALFKLGIISSDDVESLRQQGKGAIQELQQKVD
jgi:hypothetical protein